MKNNKSCQCKFKLLGAEGICNLCGFLIDPSAIEELQSKLESNSTNYDEYPLPNNDSKNNYIEESQSKEQGKRSKYLASDEAAKRTLKYATLFEDIGRFSQLLNSIGAVILIIVGFFLGLTTGYKLLYWLVILIYWWISYLNTSLLRGVSSYFQMRASAHLEKK